MLKPISYLQTDIRWASIDYSAYGEKTTIGESGCGPACMAMAVATLVDKNVTPIDTAKWALQNGYKAPLQGTYYSYFEPQGRAYGLAVKQMNYSNAYKVSSIVHNYAKDEIDKGNWVICCVGPGNWTPSGHFILWYGIEGEHALINDPNSVKKAQTKAKVNLLQKETKYYFSIEIPEQEEIMVRYKTIEEIPVWAKETVQKLINAGIISGDADGNLDLSLDMLRLLVFNDRMGLYDYKKVYLKE